MPIFRYLIPYIRQIHKEGAIEGKIVGNSIRYTKEAILSALRDIETIKYKKSLTMKSNNIVSKGTFKKTLLSMVYTI